MFCLVRNTPEDTYWPHSVLSMRRVSSSNGRAADQWGVSKPTISNSIAPLWRVGCGNLKSSCSPLRTHPQREALCECIEVFILNRWFRRDFLICWRLFLSFRFFQNTIFLMVDLNYRFKGYKNLAIYEIESNALYVLVSIFTMVWGRGRAREWGQDLIFICEEVSVIDDCWLY